MKFPVFTKENAVEMAARSTAVRRLNAEKKKQAAAVTIVNKANATPEAGDVFRDAMLINVRCKIKTILVKIDKALECKELDSKYLKDLTESLYRFESMEQKLSMRSSPASQKPPPEKAKSNRASFASPLSDPAELPPLPEL